MKVVPLNTTNCHGINSAGLQFDGHLDSVIVVHEGSMTDRAESLVPMTERCCASLLTHPEDLARWRDAAYSAFLVREAIFLAIQSGEGVGIESVARPAVIKNSVLSSPPTALFSAQTCIHCDHLNR